MVLRDTIGQPGPSLKFPETVTPGGIARKAGLEAVGLVPDLVGGVEQPEKSRAAAAISTMEELATSPSLSTRSFRRPETRVTRPAS